MQTTGYIYFIATHNEREVKIGWTSDVRKRCGELQTGSPHPLRRVYAFPGTADQERTLHKRFAKYRLRGEWFQFAEEIHDFLTDLENILAGHEPIYSS